MGIEGGETLLSQKGVRSCWCEGKRLFHFQVYGQKVSVFSFTVMHTESLQQDHHNKLCLCNELHESQKSLLENVDYLEKEIYHQSAELVTNIQWYGRRPGF